MLPITQLGLLMLMEIALYIKMKALQNISHPLLQKQLLKKMGK
jgi:hypothetical protein